MTTRHPRRVIGSWVSADLLSILGSRLAALAVPWLVLTTTGSATRTGLAAAAELAPMVLFRAFSGPLIDRLGAVRTAIVADAVSALGVVVVPLLWTAHLLSFPALLSLVAVVGAARGPGDSAKQTMLPELATATGQPLERIAGMGGTTERLASTIGLALGGVIVAVVGGADALVVTAAGFGVSALLGLVVLRPALTGDKVKPATDLAGRQGYLAEFRDGFRGLRNDPVLVGIVIMLAVTNGVDQAFIAVMMPAWILHNSLGPQTLGWLLAAFMIAAVAGSVLATTLSARLPRLGVYLVAFLIAGAPRFVIMALGAGVPAVLAVLAVAGLAAGFINPILSAVTLERAPAAIRGRVMALIGAASLALTPIGGLFGGVLVDRAGLPASLLIGGGIYFVVTMLPAVLPSWRAFGRRPEPAETPDPTPVAEPEDALRSRS